jgi:transposase
VDKQGGEAQVHLEIRGAERLSFRERQVVTLKETGVRQDAIAHQLSLSESSVATLLHRAKTKGYQVVIVIDGDPLALNTEGLEEEEEIGEGS